MEPIKRTALRLPHALSGAEGSLVRMALRLPHALSGAEGSLLSTALRLPHALQEPKGRWEIVHFLPATLVVPIADKSLVHEYAFRSLVRSVGKKFYGLTHQASVAELPSVLDSRDHKGVVRIACETVG